MDAGKRGIQPKEDRPAVLVPPRPQPIKLREYRCGCGKLLIRAELKPGSTVEAFCRDCKRHITFMAA